MYIMKGDIRLEVCWAGKEFSPEGKEAWRNLGRLILSPEELTELTNQLLEKVDSGQLAEAIDWINRYELSVTGNGR